jgi:hypothetical protein
MIGTTIRLRVLKMKYNVRMEAWQNKAGEKLAQLDSEVTVVES